MQNEYIVLDPPQFIDFEIRKIEQLESPNGLLVRLAHFQWQGKDYWIIGKMVWHNRMACGFAWVRAARGRKLYKTNLMMMPQYSPPEFVISKPANKSLSKTKEFVFEGFDTEKVVDIEFIRHEDRRLNDQEYICRKSESEKLPRPPSGLII